MNARTGAPAGLAFTLSPVYLEAFVELVRNWFRQTFNDPQVAAFTVLVVVVLAAFFFFGNALAPVIAALVIAYLLEGLVRALERAGSPRWVAVTVVFFFFTACLLLVILLLIPTLYRQVVQLVDLLPAILSQGQALLLQLPEHYPNLFSEAQIGEMLNTIRRETIEWGQRVAAGFTLRSVAVVVSLAIYAVLVPFLVFFFLKDKALMLSWLSDRLPRHRALAYEVWGEVNQQIGNYVRGKFIEIVIVWVVTYTAFTLFGLQFAMLLALGTGLSVVIPYVGAFVMTLPVALIAYFQFGLTEMFVYVVAVYTIIQVLDGNVLVPVLFSEVVNLHPVAIIVAILVFGSLWGFWGIFFAIPLATVIQSILKAWMRRVADQSKDVRGPVGES